MASKNETVSKVIDDFAYLITLGNIRPAVATNIKSRIEAAHKREVAKLKRQRKEALAIASDIDKCASIERHTDAMLKKNEVIVGLRKEVAELRECLVRRSSHLNAILQKALELRNDVPSELRKVMDECIVAEDKAIGLGVFSKKGVEDEGK